MPKLKVINGNDNDIYDYDLLESIFLEEHLKECGLNHCTACAAHEYGHRCPAG